MRCVRCEGLMLKEYMLDMEAGFGDMWTDAWRCVSCGAVYDTVIERNRLARPADISLRHNRKPVYTLELDQHEACLGGEAFIRPAA